MNVTLKVNDEMARRYLLTLAGAFPRETRRGLARYGGLLRRRMAKGVKGRAGVDFSQIREVLHPGKAGGPLSAPRTVKIEKPSRFTIVVDWMEPLRPYASRWQSGGDVGFQTKTVRHAIHTKLGALGMRDIPVDPAATQPERPVTAPVAENASREAPRVILGIVKSILKKKGA